MTLNQLGLTQMVIQLKSYNVYNRPSEQEYEQKVRETVLTSITTEVETDCLSIARKHTLI